MRRFLPHGRRGSRARRRLASRRRSPNQLIDERRIHLVTEERGGRERLAIRGRQAVRADEDAVTQAFRDRKVIADKRRDAVGDRDGMVGEERSGQLLHEERQALAPVV